ncbi:MAG: NAD(P)-binding protein [Clostridia bacterium]
MGKIIIIGAGIGGLIAAYDLGKDGYDVTIYEKNKKDEISYEWYDDSTLSILKRFDIPFPAEDTYFSKKDWAFVPPFSSKAVQTVSDEKLLNYSFYRRDFSNNLIKRASEYAKINFSTPVDSLIINNEKVEGIIINGEEIKADLVIDSSGVLSKFRASLPESFGIEKTPGKGGVFNVVRMFYERNKEFTPDLKHKIYLKHMGNIGISWFRCDFENEVDVLVGLVDKEIDDNTINKALDDLKKANPALGDKLLHGGDRCVIPVRYPLTKMVGNGYVAIGDSAFMTIPLVGSGMENSIIAGKILAKTIKNGVSKENLWNYQVEYFKEVGAENMGIDAIKRWLLRTDSQDLKFLFESGIIGEKELAISGDGGKIELSFKDKLGKLKIGYKKIGLLIKLVNALKFIDKATALGNEIPTTYNEIEINLWQDKVKKFYSKL